MIIFCFGLGSASAQTPTQTTASATSISTARVAGTIESKSGPQDVPIGELVYATAKKFRVILREKGAAFYLPAFSPDGSKIAFIVGSNFAHADPALDGADAEIVVVDTEGKVISKTLVGPEHGSDGKKITTFHIQGVENILWMGNDRVAIITNSNPDWDIGFTIPILFTGDGKPNIYNEMSHASEFVSVGPIAISQGGLHLASVGLAPSTSYSSCASVGESIEIDGVDISSNTSIPSFSVIAGLAWNGDTEVSTIIRSENGPAVLTISDIPPTFVFKPRLPSTNRESQGESDALTNPPKIRLFKIAVGPREADESFFNLAYIGTSLYFKQYAENGQVHRIWSMNRGSASSGVTQIKSSPSLDSLVRQAQERKKLVDDIIATLPPDLEHSMNSEDVWCGVANACGVLASNGSDDDNLLSTGTRVPDACLPPDPRDVR